MTAQSQELMSFSVTAALLKNWCRIIIAQCWAKIAERNYSTRQKKVKCSNNSNKSNRSNLILSVRPVLYYLMWELLHCEKGLLQVLRIDLTFFSELWLLSGHTPKYTPLSATAKKNKKRHSDEQRTKKKVHKQLRLAFKQQHSVTASRPFD